MPRCSRNRSGYPRCRCTGSCVPRDRSGSPSRHAPGSQIRWVLDNGEAVNPLAVALATRVSGNRSPSDRNGVPEQQLPLGGDGFAVRRSANPKLGLGAAGVRAPVHIHLDDPVLARTAALTCQCQPSMGRKVVLSILTSVVPVQPGAVSGAENTQKLSL